MSVRAPVLTLVTGALPAGRDAALAWAQARLARRAGRAVARVHRSAAAVLAGRHEDARQAARLGWCREHGLPVLRRPTGGAALHVEPGQLLWTLALPDDGRPLTVWLARAAEALAAAAGAALGLPLVPAAPNDLLLEGRKAGCVMAGELAGVLVLQGTFLLAPDIGAQLRALRVPREKLNPEGLRTARDRFAALAPAAGLALAAALARLRARLPEALAGLAGATAAPLAPAALAALAPRRAPVAPEGPRRPAAASATLAAPAGVLRCRLEADGSGHVRAAWIGGEAMLRPGTLLHGLARALRGAPLAAAPARARALLARRPWDGSGLGTEDLARLLERAAAKAFAGLRLGLGPEEAAALDLAGPGARDPLAVLGRAGAILVPYCAKPLWCRWRVREGCPDCGRCEVGAVYRLGRACGIPVITICSFEHLQATFRRLRAEGVEAYVGLCCGEFRLKRAEAFAASGLAGLLVDIAGANCYALGREEAAYAGVFRAQARLRGPLTRRVLAALGPGAPQAPPARDGSSAASARAAPASSSRPPRRAPKAARRRVAGDQSRASRRFLR